MEFAAFVILAGSFLSMLLEMEPIASVWAKVESRFKPWVLLVVCLSIPAIASVLNCFSLAQVVFVCPSSPNDYVTVLITGISLWTSGTYAYIFGVKDLGKKGSDSSK